ncbi:MAG: 5-(carboxyamino)imidazole ribonucleotide synthase [Clostridia bacterium]|nr:5-(carboxyamino)imidazole ribonucleotide synthase [Clostridia bacterium]MDN5322845.1 5-(carboxyamino)imidazole ribonucleotide synthase [Clostridia bacterium]
MVRKLIMPGSTIGLLGGGQLGRMVALEAKKMGYKVICLDPTQDSPCGQVADEQIVASFDNLEAAQKLGERSDVIIYEFESIDLEIVKQLEKKYYLPQKSSILAISQNRVEEKEQLKKAGFPVAPFRGITNPRQLEQAITDLGYPCILKSSRGGYDGKGQMVITNDCQLDTAREMVRKGKEEWVLEKKIFFSHEISVIAARKETGEMAVYPAAENIHRENILHVTVVPARVASRFELEASEITAEIARAFKVVGLLAVEFFITPKGLVVNEIAPRPHNSGHYTWEACFTSQFEQLIRAVCGLQLGSTKLVTPVVMVNVFGESLARVVKQVPYFPENVKFHFYGKRGSHAGKRKMGHLIIRTSDAEQAMSWAKGFI